MLPEAADPAAVVARSRRPGEEWFCLEQPDRDDYAVAGLGRAHSLLASGPDRFAEVSRRWRTVVAAALADPVEGPAGSGMIAVGGFAFDAAGSQSPEWEGFPSASLTVPELSLARGAGRTALTLTTAVAPDDTAEEIVAAASDRLAGLRPGALPLIDPSPTGSYRAAQLDAALAL